MKTKKENQEAINTNNSIIKNKINNETKAKPKKLKNIFAYDAIHLKSIYIFFLKSFFKGWYLWISFIIFISSFGMPLIFCLLNSKNSYYYLGLDFITVVNAIILTTFLSFTCTSYFKFTDLKNRITILNLKNIGYLFVIILVDSTYIFISNIITNVVFISFSILNNISFLTLYNWSFIFFLLFSFMITITLIVVYSFIILNLNSLKSSLLISEMIMNTVLFFTYLFFFINLYLFNFSNINNLFTSITSFIYYLLIFSILFIITTIAILVFKKYFILKR